LATDANQRTRDEIIEDMIFLSHAAYNQAAPTGSELSARVAAWGIALGRIATSDLMPLMHAELQHRTNPFPPVPADLLKRYDGEEIEVDGQKERVVVANAQAYQPLQPTANELYFRALKRGEKPPLPAAPQNAPALPAPVLPPVPPVFKAPLPAIKNQSGADYLEQLKQRGDLPADLRAVLESKGREVA
jgi:hypothetical protein